MSDGRFRTLVVILLAVNIFILCSIAGGTAVWLFNQQREVPVRQLPLAAEFLPDKARQALQKALGETYRAQRQMSAEAKQARIDAAALIGKPTLDIEALKAALAKARADDFTLRGQVEESAIAFAATLPVEQRQLLAQGLMQRLAPKPPAK